MCDPTMMAITSFGMQAGGALMDHQQGVQNARMQNAMYEQNRLNALHAMRMDSQQTQLRMQQEGITAGEAVFENHLQTKQNIGTANVASGEAGVTGISVARLMDNIRAVGGRETINIMTNREWNVGQLNNQLHGIRDNTIGRISSVARGVKPSALATALRIGQAGLSAHGQYKEAKTREAGHQPIKINKPED